MDTRARPWITGLAFGESPRWHDGALWLSDMHDGAVLRCEPGTTEATVQFRVAGSCSGLGWHPDGRLLVVAMERRAVLAWDGSSLSLYADLSHVATADCNDMVVDRQGRSYVGNFGSPYRPGHRREPATLALVDSSGHVSSAADGLRFPNGSVVTPDGSTLIIAETAGRCLTAFDIALDGGLSNRRVWADLGDGLPDGICLDADGAVWYADPRARACIRVAPGGAVLDVRETGAPCYACSLGGPDGCTLVMVVADLDDPVSARTARTGRVLLTEAPAQAAPPG